MVTHPAITPKRLLRSRTGTSLLTGLPFLVTSTGSPVALTSSMSFRHFALNSDAVIVLISDLKWS